MRLHYHSNPIRGGAVAMTDVFMAVYALWAFSLIPFHSTPIPKEYRNNVIHSAYSEQRQRGNAVRLRLYQAENPHSKRTDESGTPLRPGDQSGRFASAPVAVRKPA
jgi:hypothetical protein